MLCHREEDAAPLHSHRPRPVLGGSDRPRARHVTIQPYPHREALEGKGRGSRQLSGHLVRGAHPQAGMRREKPGGDLLAGEGPAVHPKVVQFHPVRGHCAGRGELLEQRPHSLCLGLSGRGIVHVHVPQLDLPVWRSRPGRAQQLPGQEHVGGPSGSVGLGSCHVSNLGPGTKSEVAILDVGGGRGNLQPLRQHGALQHSVPVGHRPVAGHKARPPANDVEDDRAGGVGLPPDRVHGVVGQETGLQARDLAAIAGRRGGVSCSF